MAYQRNLYELQLFEYLNNLKARLNVSPLVLGGFAASGGGTGGPPGGFIGELPQTKVAFDLSEVSDNTIPSSGKSLLTNLNRIRYRLTSLETNGIPGAFKVYQNRVQVASGITILDFYGDVGQITEIANGIAAVPVHKHVINEDLSSQIDGVVSGFITTNVFIANSLAVYYNGLREYGSNVFAYSGLKGFNLNYVPSGTDKITVDYLYYTTIPDAVSLSTDQAVTVTDISTLYLLSVLKTETIAVTDTPTVTVV